jgi:hypothetical protein
LKGLKEKYGRPSEDSTSEVVELDSDLEESLCQLWDMTLEQDVVDMLVDNDVMSIIMQTLEVSNAPRLNVSFIFFSVLVLSTDHAF